jgi:hypothetical protein
MFLIVNIRGKTMDSLEAITLKAFITALTQLNSPWNTDLQQKLNKLGATLVQDFTKIQELDRLAEEYPDIDELYQNARGYLQTSVAERNKSDAMILPDEEETNELHNFVDGLEKIDEEKLRKIAPELFQSLDATKEPRETIYPMISNWG